MFFLIYSLLLTLTCAHKCSFKTSIKHEDVYLCREKLNSTSIRVWLHLKFNQTEYKQNFFSYYTFTLRIIDLIDEHKVHLEDRFEKQISNYVEINRNKKENNTINIHNLPPGRYEICVNLLNNKNKHFYYRSPNSCLHIPWHVPEYEQDSPNRFLQVSLIISIIILLITIVFFIYALYQYFKSRKPFVVIHNIDEGQGTDEDNDIAERAKLLVHQHFAPEVNPFELLVRKRVHRRYSHRSPDMNDL